jgi:hypothetical protein
MTTSNSTDFTITLNEIIKDALIELNIIGSDENPSPEDNLKAQRSLNLMTKRWQAQGYHLWKKKTGTIFLQKDQAIYDLSSIGDHATETYIETTISADELSGQTTISVTSSVGMNINDFIGIEESDNSLHWSRIASIPDTTSVVINDALPTGANSGAKVYAYTIRLDQPFNVYSANRESESEIDTPMNYLSYQDYFELPDKIRSSGTPVSYNYDRQLNVARIRVWPVPNDVKTLMKITYAAKIQDFDNNDNTSDFPQEWEDALVLNLAVRLAPSFGKANSQSFIELKAQAMEALDLALRFDNEPGSIRFQVDYQQAGYYGTGRI